MERKDIDLKYKWNLEAMYESPESCEADLQRCLEMADRFREYKGSLDLGPVTFLAALKDKDSLSRKLSKAYCYAHQYKDQDSGNTRSQALADKAVMVISRVSEATSFFVPEVASLPEETLIRWAETDPSIGVYRHYIDEILRSKKHILPPEQEKLLAQLSETQGAMDDAFGMLTNVDFKFAEIEDEKGNRAPLTLGSYIAYSESRDRRVRKDAYDALYSKFGEFINTIGTLYINSVRQDVNLARIRGYESALEAAMFSDNVSTDVYNKLIEAVNKHLPALHRYVALRKKLLGLDELRMYDMYVPILDYPEEKISFEEAQEMVDEALKPLGEEYRAVVRRAYSERWIDVYENPGKRSGAYSSGSYDTVPYILMNYDDTLGSVFTLIHEMGHSMQSWLSNTNQEYINADYPIFTAEVASTVNESLLYRYLIDNAEDDLKKAYLINKYLDGFKGTLFRQTQFAEFEKAVHEAVEAGEAPTNESLSRLYGSLNAKYYGDAVVTDEQISMEWARIPHFYSAFYVYQYATGHSAATAISRAISKGEPMAVENYLEFLKSGGRDYPVELLKLAGVDMSTPQPVEAALETFEELLAELEELIEKLSRN